ncbi:hypothetical protein VTN49DRAFT_6701 [Thermomyces lanuginosus]|uniref:uncharacterized protein n=1 Tax=Thermomyces lanuginosus TaxID=5541 RepID=UPI00374340F5
MADKVTTRSPFRLSPEALADLDQNRAFQSMRRRLQCRGHATEQFSFCASHHGACSDDEKTTFLLHRDIIYTILQPLFDILDQATQIAATALGDTQRCELERMFRGDARGAFTWLHCILTDERQFCLAEGCPACVVLHALHSEPTIRVLAVACLLCDVADDLNIAKPLQGHVFWLPVLEKAVCDDPLWGDGFWPDIEQRARSLAMDIKQLIEQCAELRNRNPETVKTLAQRSSCSAISMQTVTDRQHIYRLHVRSIPAEPSAFARRQLSMILEDQELASTRFPTCKNVSRRRWKRDQGGQQTPVV